MINPDPTNPAPEGNSILSPYLIVDNVEEEIDFLKRVFDAEVKEQIHQPDGKTVHGEVRIGDVIVMIGKASGENQSTAAMNFVYVKDTDAVYKRALKNGAVSIMEPTDQYYGSRDAGFRDKQGYQWWAGQFIRRVPKEEMEKAVAQRANK